MLVDVSVKSWNKEKHVLSQYHFIIYFLLIFPLHFKWYIVFSKILRWKRNFKLQNARMHYFFNMQTFIAIYRWDDVSCWKSEQVCRFWAVGVERYHTVSHWMMILSIRWFLSIRVWFHSARGYIYFFTYFETMLVDMRFSFGGCLLAVRHISVWVCSLQNLCAP